MSFTTICKLSKITSSGLYMIQFWKMIRFFLHMFVYYQATLKEKLIKDASLVSASEDLSQL